MSMAIGAIGTQAASFAGMGGGFSGGYGGARSVRYGADGAPSQQGVGASGAVPNGGRAQGGQAANGAPESENVQERNKRLGKGCQTCEKRTYQDGSNDPGVSFQSPTAIRPEAAGSAVMAHEQEHVTREQARARREDRVVLSQSVTLHTGICPECHRAYVAGGTTRTTTAAAKQRYTQVMAQTGVGAQAKDGAKLSATA